MTPDQLTVLHTTALQRHWRSLLDAGGTPTPGYLADVVAIAQEHAAGNRALPVTAQQGGHAPDEPEHHGRHEGRDEDDGRTQVLDAAPARPAARTAPRRRQPARRGSAK